VKISSSRLFLIFLVVYAVFVSSVLLLNITYEHERGDFPIYEVGSASMEPTLKVGDKVVIKLDYSATQANIISEGDIIALYELDGSKVVLSRVVEKYQDENGTLCFVTKADANTTNDPWSPISVDEVMGKVVAVKLFLPTYMPGFTALLLVSAIFGVCCLSIIFYSLYMERKQASSSSV